MANSALSNVSASSDDKNLSFASYENTYKALLNLVHQQINSSHRFLRNDHDFRSMALPLTSSSHKTEKRVRSVDKFTLTSNESKSNINKSCQANGGHGDATADTETWDELQKNKKEENVDEDEIIDLEWTMNFNSIDDLMEYRKKYVTMTIGNLVENNNQSLGAPQDSSKTSNRQLHQTFHEDSDLAFDSTNSVAQQNAPTGFLGLGSSIVKNLSLVPSFIRKIGFFLICLLAVSKSMHTWAENKFTYILDLDEIGWPGSVFMKEPLLKDYIYSSRFGSYLTGDYF